MSDRGITQMAELGWLVLGLAMGVLIGMAMVWDSRFNAGRRYGYSQYCEKVEGEDAIARIRSML